MRSLIKLLLIPAAGVLAAGIILAAGLIDFSASKPAGHLEERVATFALNRSIARHAPKAANPLARSPQAAAAGLALFKTHCVECHGAPGIDPTEAGASLNPPAPGLTLPRVQARSDGELHWIVSNGIRMTGMPAFGGFKSEEEIWQLVAAVRRLSRLTPEERRILASPQER